MLISYARVSPHDQNLDLQREALAAAGCARVIVDTISGAASAHPGLAQVKDVLGAGDTLVVWRLDRLARSLRDLISWVAASPSPYYAPLLEPRLGAPSG